MANNAFSRGELKVSGRKYEVAKGATFDPGGVKRTPLQGDQTGKYFTTEVMPSKLECDLVAIGSVDPVALGRLQDETVTYRTDIGQTYVINHAYTESAPILNEADGKAKLVIYGPPAELML